ncbi:MAG: sensor histidine kinase/response regulator [Labilithrix sp.]|nr:sensor histidine kinase/response regulator [Labilithrix sp.]
MVAASTKPGKELDLDYELLTRVLDVLPDPVFVKDEQHRWVAFNDAFCAFLGKTREELLGRSDYDFFPKHEADVFWEKDAIVLAGKGTNENEEELTHASGVRHILCTRKSSFTMTDGRQRLVGIIRDVTERRRMEVQVLETERLVAVGTLAAGVAHEINNPLTYVTCNIDHAVALLDQLEAERGSAAVAELRACLADAADGTRRVAGIVADLRTLARPHAMQKDADVAMPLVAVDLQAAIQASLRMVNLVTRHRARVDVGPKIQELPAVAAVEPRLCQVLVNVVANAAHAFGNDNPTRNLITVDAEVGTDTVEIIVRDNGPGIAPARLARILDPFVTGGSGMGLGLSISVGIVRSFGGSLRIASDLGVGTSVRVKLRRVSPVSEADERARESADPHASPSREHAAVSTKRCVLVVDDEPMICKLANRILSREFDVVIASSAAEALAAIEKKSPPFDAVLCDIRMPGGSGLDLWANVRERWPSLAKRFVFATGGVDSTALEERLAATGQPWVGKPFPPEKIIDALTRIAKR